jgi:histidyl-tRNA synthetase
VGISLGVSRLLVPLLNRGDLIADRSVPSVVLVALNDEDSRAAADGLATRLRANAIPCEVAPAPQKFGKQIRYAERRGIPYVLFETDDGPQMKDIRSGDQVAVDPDTWAPPAEDLKPRIRVSTSSTNGSEKQ